MTSGDFVRAGERVQHGTVAHGGMRRACAVASRALAWAVSRSRTAVRSVAGETSVLLRSHSHACGTEKARCAFARRTFLEGASRDVFPAKIGCALTFRKEGMGAASMNRRL